MSQSIIGRSRAALAGFTTGQRAVVIVAVLGLALGVVGLTRWVAQPTWSPLFGNLSGSDASAIVEQLQAQHAQYKLADGGSTILVPQAQVYDLRVAMSGKGLPAGDSSSSGGYSLLDKQGITATDFQQNVAYRRALEGELSKTLQAMDGVQVAVVHLALPKKDVFATEQDKPTASVLLELGPGITLSRTQVRSVTHLVAGSVEGLDPGQVTVSDSTGRLLSSSDTGADSAASAADETDEQTAQYEDRVGGALQQMLDRVLGPGRSVVRVNAQLNFDTRDTTSETFVPQTQVSPLAEATVSETFNGAAAGAGGALGQTLPTLTGVAGGTNGGAYQRSQRTVDNAVGKVVERTQAAPGSVERMTVAVVLDATTAGTVDPNQVQQLVANAVGLDPKRGDSVQVDKIAFDTTAATQAKKELAEAQSKAATAGYLDLGKKVGLGLLVVIIAFLALRRGRREPDLSIDALAEDLGVNRSILTGAERGVLTGPADLPALPVGGISSVNQDHLRDEVTELVDNQPEEVARMLQAWLAERA
jgi:flagellar M-ring protein FliF